MITLYELLHHTTATKYHIMYKTIVFDLDAENFMEHIQKWGGCLVWQFSAAGKDELEIIIKDA